MKINWGWGIVIFLTIFVGSIVYRVYIASQQQINLVTPDYYPKGITHEEEIAKKANYESLASKLNIEQTSDSLRVTIPGKSLSNPMTGHVLVYRPSNFELDSLYNFNFLDSNRTLYIPKDYMIKGLYEIQVDWQEDSLFYYTTETVYINK